MTVSLGSLLAEDSIILDASATGVEDAIRQAGAALVAAGAVDEEYIDAMLERETSVSTYVGEGVAVPHGTFASKGTVTRTALVLLRLSEAVDWNGSSVTVVIGLAAKGRGHIKLLSQVASVLLNPERAQGLRSAGSAAEVYAAIDAVEV